MTKKVNLLRGIGLQFGGSVILYSLFVIAIIFPNFPNFFVGSITDNLYIDFLNRIHGLAIEIGFALLVIIFLGGAVVILVINPSSSEIHGNLEIKWLYSGVYIVLYFFILFVPFSIVLNDLLQFKGNIEYSSVYIFFYSLIFISLIVFDIFFMLYQRKISLAKKIVLIFILIPYNLIFGTLSTLLIQRDLLFFTNADKSLINILCEIAVLIYALACFILPVGIALSGMASATTRGEEGKSSSPTSRKERPLQRRAEVLSHIESGSPSLDREVEGSIFPLTAVTREDVVRLLQKAKSSHKAVNFSRCNLAGIDLSKAHLQRANLFEANLSGADLQGADLFEANLFGADLQGAHLSEARLQGATLRGAHLRGAHLQGAHLQGAHLFGAKLDNTDLKEAIMTDGSRHP